MLVAYDIDGALTKASVRDWYRRRQRESGVRVGIVTARPAHHARTFVRKHNLDTDFMEAVDTFGSKTMALKGVAGRHAPFDHSERLYVGSYLRDRVAAHMAGWRYTQA